MLFDPQNAELWEKHSQLIHKMSIHEINDKFIHQQFYANYSTSPSSAELVPSDY